MSYPDFMKNTSPDKYNEDQKKIADSWYEYKRHDFGVEYKSITLDCKIKQLKAGMTFDGDTIIAVDYANNIVIAKYEDYVYLYLITNPDTKPSLYNSSKNLSYLQLL